MTPHAPIVGADRLTGHFGGWPSFHDAEVVRLVLDRHGTDGPTAELVVHVWSVGAEVDPDGRFPRREHALVRLLLERIASVDLAGFNHQNVLFSLDVVAETVGGTEGVRVTLDPSFGVGGSIVCRRVVVADVRPCDETGRPSDP